MSIVLIERRICLEPVYLTSNIRSHLLSKIREQTKGECTEENGHLLEVKSLKIIDNRISPATSGIVFTVKFEVLSVKPEKGKNLIGNVCMLSSKGIFIDVMNVLQVLIPITSMPGYKLNKTGTIFVNSKNKRKIQEGDTVTVCISEVTYKDKKFISFGSIVEDA